MKKNIKVLLTILIIGFLLIILTGCGNKENENDDEKNEETVINENTIEQKEEKVEGKSGSFVEYKGYTYYWKIDAGSREGTGLFSNYKDSLNYKNDLIRFNDSGEEVVISDKGSGDIFIVNDKIFLSYTADEYGNNRNIYSVDLDGNNKTEYCSGEMKYIVDDYIYGQTDNNGDIFIIDTKTDKVDTIKKKANIIGCEDGVIYYTNEFDYTAKNLTIGSIEGKEDNGIIYTFDSSNFEYYERPVTMYALTMWKENGKLNTCIGYSEGSANLLQELVQIEMEAERKNAKLTNVELSYGFYEEEQNIKGKVYFKTVNPNADSYNELVYVDKETGEIKELVKVDEINEKYGFVEDDEHQTSLYCADAVGDDVYVIIDYSEHYPEGDVGWRYTYKRLKTVCFKYNLKSKEIEDIYDF